MKENRLQNQNTKRRYLNVLAFWPESFKQLAETPACLLQISNRDRVGDKDDVSMDVLQDLDIRPKDGIFRPIRVASLAHTPKKLLASRFTRFISGGMHPTGYVQHCFCHWSHL